MAKVSSGNAKRTRRDLGEELVLFGDAVLAVACVLTSGAVLSGRSGERQRSGVVALMGDVVVLEGESVIVVNLNDGVVCVRRGMEKVNCNCHSFSPPI